MDNYLGEIRIFAGNYAPVDWAICDGSLKSISQYDALFSLIGTTYGGDGVTTFALPDMRGRIGVSQGQLSGTTSSYVMGQSGGVSQVTLLTTQIPSHTHNIIATTVQATTGDPTNNFLAASNGNGTGTPPYPDVALYTTLPLPSGPTAPNVQLDPATLTPAGNSLPHSNMMPYVCINYIIAMYGIYPSFS